MKYGPIICDPNSEEAKALAGKKVLGASTYQEISKETGHTGTLRYIQRTSQSPFMIAPDCIRSNGNALSVGYTFIREVIEEIPTYRPYKDTEEMIDDFCERFEIVKTNYSMPSIWLKSKETGNVYVGTYYSDEKVGFNTMDDLFNDFTYLDGSPVGKEVTE